MTIKYANLIECFACLTMFVMFWRPAQIRLSSFVPQCDRETLLSVLIERSLISRNRVEIPLSHLLTITGMDPHTNTYLNTLSLYFKTILNSSRPQPAFKQNRFEHSRMQSKNSRDFLLRETLPEINVLSLHV